jgi:TRAP-type C4-dicarboxylate transport system permease small subunit
MKRFLEVGETLAALMLLAVALLVSLNVGIRDLLDIQLPDWFDLSRMLLCIAMFWGVAIATYRGGHICVDVVWEHLGPHGRRWLDVAATVLVLILLGPLAWMVWGKVLTLGSQATSDLRIPLVYFFSIAAAGATFAVVLGVLRLWELARGS